MDFEQFLKFVKIDGKPLKLSPVQKRLWELIEKDPNAKLNLLFPRHSTFAQTFTWNRIMANRLARALNQGDE